MRIAAIIAGLLVCGFVLWSLAVQDWRRSRRPQRRVTAVVVDHETSTDSDGRTYAARLRFTAAGRQIEVCDDLWKPFRHPRIGARVALRYPEGQPELACVPRPGLRMLAYVVTGGLGLVMIALLLGLIDGAPIG